MGSASHTTRSSNFLERSRLVFIPLLGMKSGKYCCSISNPAPGSHLWRGAVLDACVAFPSGGSLVWSLAFCGACVQEYECSRSTVRSFPFFFCWCRKCRPRGMLFSSLNLRPSTWISSPDVNSSSQTSGIKVRVACQGGSNIAGQLFAAFLLAVRILECGRKRWVALGYTRAWLV